jgi:hypothetical protein
MMTISSTYGFGRDMNDILIDLGPEVGMEAITKAILYSAIGQTILVVGTVLSKTSLALFPASPCRNTPQPDRHMGPQLLPRNCRRCLLIRLLVLLPAYGISMGPPARWTVHG